MAPKKGSSESSDSDDDHLAHLREAADTNFINDSMFQLAGNKSQESTKPANVLQSQRYITNDNDHIDDHLIPEEVQKFVSKKLTKIIESQIEFVDVKIKDKKNMETTSQSMQEEIALLGGVVLKIDWNDTAAHDAAHDSKTKKPVIRKRHISDVDDSKNESLRLKESVIDVKHFPKEMSEWNVKPKGTLFEYREKNGSFFEVEPKTEFSEKRKKNNWNESKISRNKTSFR